jgi:hypothetical protein
LDEKKDTDRCRMAITLILRSLSSASRQLVNTVPEWDEACDNSKVYDVFDIIRQSHSTGNGGFIIDHLIQLISLKQGKQSHEAFLEKYLELTKSVATDFKDPDHPGYLKLSHFFSIVYIAGIDAEYFATKIDSAYSKYPSGKIDDHMALIADFQSYHQQKTKILSRTPEAVPDNTESNRALWTGTADGSLTVDCRECTKKTTLDKPDDPPFCRDCARRYHQRHSRAGDKKDDKKGPYKDRPKTSVLTPSARALAANAAFDTVIYSDGEGDEETFVNPYQAYIDGR